MIQALQEENGTGMNSDVEPFRAIVISRLAHELERSGKSVIHMEFGQPSTGAPKAALSAAQKVLASDPMGYWESQELKERIVRRYADLHGVKLSADQITLTCGASRPWCLRSQQSSPRGTRWRWLAPVMLLTATRSAHFP